MDAAFDSYLFKLIDMVLFYIFSYMDFTRLQTEPLLCAHGPLGWIATAAEAEDLGFHGLTHRTARVVASYDKHGALRTLRAYSDLISIVCDAIKKQDMMIYRSTINLS